MSHVSFLFFLFFSIDYEEYLKAVEKRPSLNYLRAKGEGLAAEKCIHIDWQSSTGRKEAKIRKPIREEKLRAAAEKRKKIAAKRKYKQEQKWRNTYAAMQMAADKDTGDSKTKLVSYEQYADFEKQRAECVHGYVSGKCCVSTKCL